MQYSTGEHAVLNFERVDALMRSQSCSTIEAIGRDMRESCPWIVIELMAGVYGPKTCSCLDQRYA